MALAAQNRWSVKCADATVSFFHSNKVTQDIFVVPVKEAGHQGRLWKLLQHMYGLEDSGRHWYIMIAEALKKLICKRVETDHAMLYYHESEKLQGIITMHVDDILYCGSDIFIESVIKLIFSIFKFGFITEDDAYKTLGWNIYHSSDGSIAVSQEDYVESRL